MALLRRLKKEDGLTVLVATHDPAVSARADLVFRMADGGILP